SLVPCTLNLRENSHVERQRYPGASGTGTGVSGTRTAGRPLSAGDQGGARSASGLAVRARGLLVLLAWWKGVLGGGATRTEGTLPRTPGVPSPRIRLRTPHRDRPASTRDRRIAVRTQRRQGLSGQDAFP